MRRAVSIALAVLAVISAGPAAAAEAAAPAAPKQARLEGTASFDRHRRVVGAAVLARAEGDGPLFWLTSTDDRGAFYFDRLPEGTYRVELKREGYAPIVKAGIALRFPYRAVVEVTLAPETGKTPAPPAEAPHGKHVRLTGTVTVRGAGALGEARVRLVHADRPDDPLSTLTGPDGTFEFGDISAGAWRIEVLGPGYLPLRMNVDLAGDARAEAILVPQPANYVAPALDMLPPEEPIPPPTAR